MAKDGKNKKKDAGVEFLDGILALIPEEKREAVKESLSQDKVLDLIGDGVLRQSDYSRSMDELREEQKKAEYEKSKFEDLYNRNVTWLEGQKSGIEKFKADIKTRDEMIAKLKRSRDDDDFDDDEPRPKTPDIDMSKFLTVDDFKKAVGQYEQDTLSIISVVPRLSLKHFKDYGEVLDTNDLFKHAQKTGLALDRAYDDMTKDLSKKRQEDEIEKRIAAARKEGLEEGLAKVREGGGLPYPVGNNEPTTMDGLTAQDKSQFGVKAALDEYWASQSTAGKPPSD